MPGTDADDICIYDNTDNEKSGCVMQPLFYCFCFMPYFSWILFIVHLIRIRALISVIIGQYGFDPYPEQDTERY